MFINMFNELVVCGCPYGSYKHDTEKELALLRGGRRSLYVNILKKAIKFLELRRIKCQNVLNLTWVAGGMT